jgi:hypothetical protein
VFGRAPNSLTAHQQAVKRQTLRQPSNLSWKGTKDLTGRRRARCRSRLRLAISDGSDVRADPSFLRMTVSGAGQGGPHRCVQENADWSGGLPAGHEAPDATATFRICHEKARGISRTSEPSDQEYSVDFDRDGSHVRKMPRASIGAWCPRRIAAASGRMGYLRSANAASSPCRLPKPRSRTSQQRG